jgi:hypothetical protein
MAYDYISLVNEVNARLNEVPLTSTNFPTATGFYRQVKESVNAAVRDINQTHYEWPFNHAEQEEVLSANTTRYDYPIDASTIDLDSFRIVEDEALGNKTVKLRQMLYQDYLDNYIDQEYSVDEAKASVPEKVFLTPAREIGFYPKPDKAYTVLYEYYRTPVDLELATDVPTIPERYRHIIIDGAMYHAYMFRSNEQAAALSKSKFEEGIKRMRILLINDYQYMRSTYRPSPSIYTFGPRVR